MPFDRPLQDEHARDRGLLDRARDFVRDGLKPLWDPKRKKYKVFRDGVHVGDFDPETNDYKEL